MMQDTATSTRTARSSNYELLRIIAMLMILSLHSFAATDGCFPCSVSTGIDFLREACCISAVNTYVLISGYFSIKWKTKNCCALVYQILFWLLLVYGVAVACGLTAFSATELFRRLNGIAGAYWFVAVYLILYLIAPVLNAFAEQATQRELGRFLLVFFAVQTYFSLLSSPIFGIGCNVLSFAGLYLTGAYIRKGNLTQWAAGHKPALHAVLTTSTLLIAAMMWTEFFGAGCSMLQIKTSFWGLAYNNPLVIVQSVAIFLLFSTFHIQSRPINAVASSVLAVYLLHMHPDVKQWYYDYTWSLYGLSLPVHYGILSLLFAMAFAVAIAVDRIRLVTFQLLYNRITSRRNDRS